MAKQLLSILTVLLFAGFVSLASAEQTGGIVGSVVDKHSGEPLPNANVVIQETNRGGAANEQGRFELHRVPAGSYTIRVTRIGYKPAEYDVQVESNSTTHLDVLMRAQAVRFREVLVSATREHALASEVAVATEIITRDEIEKTGAQNVGEVLENATGLFVKNYGDVGALKTVSIRGASENQVLILLDGQRLNLAQGIAPDLSDLPLQAVERIEVIRGGHSALYGTDAVGGIVNLITRSSMGKERVYGNINSTIGSFGTRVMEANFGQSLGRLDYFVAHNYTTSDGDFEFEDSQGQSVERTNNDLRWNDTFAKLRYAFNSSATISGYLQVHDAERGAPGPLSFSSDAAVQKDESWKYNLRYEHQLSANWGLEARTFLYKFKQNFDDSSAFIPIESEHKNDAYGLTLQSDWQVTRFNKLTAGYEFREDKINSTDVSTQDRTIHSLFLQDQVRLNLGDLLPKSYLSFIPALRMDKFSDVDAEYSPKLGVLFNHVSDVQVILRGSWGRSFRVPSFNDLYWPAGAFTAGNPDLIPEKGVGFDFGFSLNFNKFGFWGFEANYFETSLDNLIIWGPGDDGVWSPENLQKANIQGIETKLSYQVFDNLVDFQADYNYLDAVDDSDDEMLQGNRLIYRPEHKVDLKLNLNLGRFGLNGIYRFVSERFTNADNSNSLDSYSLTDIGGSWKQPLGIGNLKLYLEVKNIFDEQIQIIEGFPIPGREFRTTLGFQFQ